LHRTSRHSGEPARHSGHRRLRRKTGHWLAGYCGRTPISFHDRGGAAQQSATAKRVDDKIVMPAQNEANIKKIIATAPFAGHMEMSRKI
jgi:hypothetical protein